MGASLRPRAEILASVEKYRGSTAYPTQLLEAILETHLDLRELLGVELYFTPHVEVNGTMPEPPVIKEKRTARLSVGPRAGETPIE